VAPISNYAKPLVLIRNNPTIFYHCMSYVVTIFRKPSDADWETIVTTSGTHIKFSAENDDVMHVLLSRRISRSLFTELHPIGSIGSGIIFAQANDPYFREKRPDLQRTV
jgi:hypothetical protein